jgi:hypothetical protein
LILRSFSALGYTIRYTTVLMRTRICRYIARCADSLRVNANDEDLAIGVLSKPTGCSGGSGAGGS